MDLATMLEQLREADRHVVFGERLIARQRELLGLLQRDGHDTREAEEVMRVLEKSQELHVSGRDRIRTEIAMAT
jgi:hypothetical protein